MMANSVLLAGGTGGLGSAVTRKLVADGWRVVVPWIVEDELARLPQSELVVPIQADLFDEGSVREVVELASNDRQRPLCALVNLVGGFAMGSKVGETPIDDFDSLMRLNLRPLYLLSHAALPKIVDAGGGSVVGVSAKSAFSPFAGASAYITSKSAVWAFISSLAVEYQGDGVRANAILPSVIDTPGNRDSQPNADRSNWVTPEAIADVIAFLLSDASRAITGAQIPVPGVAGSH